MKNYLHIGLGKAASTTLQAAVFGNIPSLEFVGRHGVALTDRNKAINAITHLNSFSYDENKVLAGLSLDFTRPFLISDEMCSTYSRIDPFIIACRLKKIIGDAKVLLITREPEDWLNSLYFFRLERGHQDVFQDNNAWLRYHIRTRQVGSPLLQVFYGKLFETYESVFGQGSVTLLPFEILKRDVKRFYRNIEAFLDIGENAINHETLKSKVYKKRFTADHYAMIRLLFDVEANRVLLDRLIDAHFSQDVVEKLSQTDSIDDYRKIMVKNILAMNLDCKESARVVFDRPLIRQIYNLNHAVDREIEKRHGILLKEYGYKVFRAGPESEGATGSLV